MNLTRLAVTAPLVLTAGMFTSGVVLHAMGDHAASAQGDAGAASQVPKEEDQKAESPAEQAAREAKLRELREKSVNNLKQIALAMHNFASLSNPPRFPGAAIRDKKGKPLLSWRVAVLPYLEQNALYEKFHLDEPWDSPHNKALLKQIPEVYVPVIRRDEPKISTYYQVITGAGALFESEKGPGLLDVKDGTSNTIMVVEAGSPVPWTKPEDVTYDKEKPLPKLGRMFGDGFNAAFADGSVRFLRTGIAEQVMRALITHSGGEVLAADSF